MLNPADLDLFKVKSDVVTYEAPRKYSLDKVTVPDGSTCELGSVIGKRTADGLCLPLDPAASDGTEVAAGVSITPKEVADGEADIFIVCRHGIVRETGLVWPDGISPEAKAAAVAQLKDIGVLVDQ